ncbi:MAG: hypothetical protein ACR2G4_04675 [Pyrinomonadaceae bacterium]
MKNKKKEKRFEPVVKQTIEEYAGKYVGIMPDYYLEVVAGADGKLSIVSHEGGRRATLQDIRLAGARLTATRIYTDGTTKQFEGTFADRILNGDSRFGMMVENLEIEFEDMTFNRLFYQFVAQP